MHPSDEDKIAFTTGWQIYCYKVCPSGSNTGATFQHIVDKVFKYLIRVAHNRIVC